MTNGERPSRTRKSTSFYLQYGVCALQFSSFMIVLFNSVFCFFVFCISTTYVVQGKVMFSHMSVSLFRVPSPGQVGEEPPGWGQCRMINKVRCRIGTGTMVGLLRNVNARSYSLS